MNQKPSVVQILKSVPQVLTSDTLGIFLAILGAVLAVVQVALGLQIIHNSLHALNIL